MTSPREIKDEIDVETQRGFNVLALWTIPLFLLLIVGAVAGWNFGP